MICIYFIEGFDVLKGNVKSTKLQFVEPLSPQKETHNDVVGFLFSKKSQIHLRFFLENKKTEFL